MTKLKNKTERLVGEAKELVNQTFGDLLKTGACDLFELDGDEEDAAGLSMMMKCMSLCNQSFDLAIAQAEVIDEMNDKLNKLEELNKKLTVLLERTAKQQ